MCCIHSIVVIKMMRAVLCFLLFTFFHEVSCNIAEFRIVGGMPVTNDYQFPYAVSIQRKLRHSCGGAIISPTMILTAAHCIAYRDKTHFTVITGILNLNESVDDVQKFTVIESIVHPGFNKSTMVHDIALLTLNKAIVFDTRTKVVPLRAKSVKLGEKLTVCGWGRTSRHSPVSETLQGLQVNALKTSECKHTHSRRGSKFTLRHSNICSSPISGEGTCKGDSGGPLVDSDHRLVGVVSWGKPCAKGVPDVFTSISHHYKWIVDHL